MYGQLVLNSLFSVWVSASNIWDRFCSLNGSIFCINFEDFHTIDANLSLVIPNFVLPGVTNTYWWVAVTRLFWPSDLHVLTASVSGPWRLTRPKTHVPMYKLLIYPVKLYTSMCTLYKKRLTNFCIACTNATKKGTGPIMFVVHQIMLLIITLRWGIYSQEIHQELISIQQ